MIIYQYKTKGVHTIMENNTPWLVLVTHGEFAQALIESTEMIAGKLNNICTISLMLEESPEELYEKVLQTLNKINSKEVLFLIDLFGGTPSNVCAMFAKRGFLAIAGLSMPMLLEADNYRNSDKDWNKVLDYLENEVSQNFVVNLTKRANKIRVK